MRSGEGEEGQGEREKRVAGCLCSAGSLSMGENSDDEGNIQHGGWLFEFSG